MSTLLFYKKPVALNREVHRDTRLKPLADGFSYASKINAIPLALIELADASVEYPVVFLLQENGEGTPAALTGMRDKENLFVTADRRWDGGYIPAFVRRYPFALYEQPDSEELYVLIDEQAPGFNAEDGERLFAEDGKESPMLAQALQFVEYFKGEGARVREFIATLRKHDLLIPNSISMHTPNGGKLVMDGFYVVDEARLSKLDDASLLVLARNGDLTRIHAHLLSLNNAHKLIRRLESRLAAELAA
jgi:hypothetical protein